jgi:hypothetical protein
MTEATGALLWLAAIVAAGVVGSLLILRHLPGTRALGAFILWLPAPYLVVAAVLGANGDPTLNSSQATYNFQLAFVLAAFVITIPWAIANLVGGLIGKRMRRKDPPLATPAAATRGSADDGLPDWSRSDAASLSLADISELMSGIAARAGIAEKELPQFGPTSAEWGTFIDRDKFDFIYFALDRGGMMFDMRTVVSDQLMYWVFRDRAYAAAANHLAENPTTPDRYARLLADKQQDILAGIDPRWAVQFAYERRHKAGR